MYGMEFGGIDWSEVDAPSHMLDSMDLSDLIAMTEMFEDADFSGPNGAPPSFLEEMKLAGLPAFRTLDPAETEAQRRGMASRIFSDWSLLRDVLDRHQATINKRWAKKTAKQRVELLLTIWPKMSAVHRPDFDALARETPEQRHGGTKFRDAYLWPFINLEDLSKPRPLLLLLDSRGRNWPDAFVMADCLSLQLARAALVVELVSLHGYEMMFKDRRTPDTYGQLTKWENLGSESYPSDIMKDTIQWALTRKGLYPGFGLAVLEIQERLFRFLVLACQHVMHDIPADQLISNQYAIQPRLDLTAQTIDSFTSLSVMRDEAPYRLPACLDLARLEALFAARLARAEDHIWALREDPGYFADVLLEFKEHRPELMKDRNGQPHPIFSTGRKDLLWQRVLEVALTLAHQELEVWDELLAQVQHIRVLFDAYSLSSSNTKSPDDLHDALLKFLFYLEQGRSGPLDALKHIATASPPLRKYYTLEPSLDPTSQMYQMGVKPNVRLPKLQATFKRLLEMLFQIEGGEELFLIGLPAIVDEMDHLIQSEASVKDMVSALVGDLLGDCAIFAEGQRQVDLYQPLTYVTEETRIRKADGFQEEYYKRPMLWGHIAETFNDAKIAALANPEGGRFSYPVHKRRTKENVEAMRSAEACLDAFWAAVDCRLKKRGKDKPKLTALCRLLAQPRTLHRTPVWTGVTETQDADHASTSIEPLIRPLSKLYLSPEQSKTTTSGRQLLKENVPLTPKAKTRGAPDPASTDTSANSTASSRHNVSSSTKDQTEASPTSQPPTQSIFHLDARALKVFRTLFYTPSINATPGEVAWKDFLHAMSATGFVPVKLYGSIWQFVPRELDVERSIQFHEPHPVAKLPYKTARRFGRRLERAYGWVGSMFVLREKPTE